MLLTKCLTKVQWQRQQNLSTAKTFSFISGGGGGTGGGEWYNQLKKKKVTNESYFWPSAL